MSATDELRRLLDERGVEYEVDDAKTVRVTRWRAYGDWVCFIEYDNGDTKFCIDARRLTPEQAIAATLGPCDDSCNCTNGERTDLAAENAMLREQMERLVTLLRNDCDIDASWDGLRRFWSIELTEGGCLMRDRACKAEAENARLRAMRDTWAENDARLRELVRDMYEMAYPEYPSAFDATFADRLRELGVEP